jgi:hypothetical protein
MSRRSLSRVVLLGVLVLLLSGPTLYAGEPFRIGPFSVASEGILTQFWSFVSSIWAKNGCEIDPNGVCVLSPATATSSDNGCGLDPDGHCLTGLSTLQPSENGCGLDPDGRCRN